MNAFGFYERITRSKNFCEAAEELAHLQSRAG